MTDTWLIVGLGNPGPEYSHTGTTSARWSWTSSPRVSAAASSRTNRGPGPRRAPGHWRSPDRAGQAAVLHECIRGPGLGPAQFYGIDPAHVIAVHDEIDIPFDTVKLKIGGGEGGHNGLRDISKALATKDYLRVRVGVGVRRAGWTPQTSSFATFPPRRRRNCPSSSTQPPTPSKSWSRTDSWPPSKNSTRPRPLRTRRPGSGQGPPVRFSHMAGFLSKLSAFQL